jgi:hypothetical protein
MHPLSEIVPRRNSLYRDMAHSVLGSCILRAHFRCIPIKFMRRTVQFHTYVAQPAVLLVTCILPEGLETGKEVRVV